MNPSDRDFNYVNFLENHIREAALDVAGHLRDMADKVEREGKRRKVEELPHTVTHIVMWGLANAHLDNLSRRLNDLREAKEASDAAAEAGEL